ncbi:hypothetical protein [Halorubrum sp. DTA46]|uniref:hypothetical protein n=1 Tax=Halorubrum sp. DTA46 TaxID=3402162 RepID=UPI003AB07BBB
MLGGSWMLTFAAVAALAGVATVGGLWVRNYRKDSVDAPEATRKTSRRVVAVISGAVLAVAIAFVELAGLLGVVGDVVSMFPGGVTQLALGALAIAGFQGWIEVGVVGFSLLVVGVLVASTALTNGGTR